jgi:hypothetical protein
MKKITEQVPKIRDQQKSPMPDPMRSYPEDSDLSMYLEAPLSYRRMYLNYNRLFFFSTSYDPFFVRTKTMSVFPKIIHYSN